MNKSQTLLKTSVVIVITLMLVVAGNGCAPAQEVANMPVIQTVEITQLVTQYITQEVTVVIEVPVTVTPLPTPPFIITSTITPSPEPPVVSILEYSDCLYGPGAFYLYKTSLLANSQMEAVGRSQDASWLYVQEVHGWNPCWLPATRVNAGSLDLNTLPAVYSKLPHSNQYNPPVVKATRENDKVYITWGAVWMSIDDVLGYLIEAWVCQGGKQVFQPVYYGTTYKENNGTMSAEITDEAGCVDVSHARIYSVGKRGYSTSAKIFWPPY